MRRLFLLLLFLCSAAVPAVAQNYDARRSALAELAEIFGELHHIRRLCEPDRESDVWRERMKRLIDLEQPAFDVREAMVVGFNRGYSAAQERFAFCDRDAEDYAAMRAGVGDGLVAQLSAPLYSERSVEEEGGVTVFRGAPEDDAPSDD